jgi:hypothetical protein
MPRSVRILLLVICIVQAVFAVLFILQTEFVKGRWPFPNTGPLSMMFVGSIFAAAAAATLWCLVSNVEGALSGVALDYLVILAPLTVFSFQTGTISGNAALMAYSGLCLIGFYFGLWLYLYSQRIPTPDKPKQPLLLRGSFAVFGIALILTGGALVLKTPNILPWPVTPELSVVIGWMFLGASAYFIYSVLRPSWANSGGQLAGFLIYDLILVVPFINRLSTIDAQLLPNLIIYFVIIGYSSLLAIYYLFVNPSTRLWGMRSRDLQTAT